MWFFTGDLGVVSSTLGLLGAVDRLYEAVVTDPGAWTETAFADWANDVASSGLDREQGRAIRRCLRTATRLRDFWMDSRAVVPTEDWRTRVDVALGNRAWRPTLDLAMAGLESDPSEELFEDVKQRFRVVNNQPWMEHTTYEEWASD